jgi:heme exporter protein C
MTRLATPVFSVLAAIGCVVSVWLVFEYAPLALAPNLYFNQKIFYWHVAHAFMLFLAVGVCGVCSLVYLKKRDPRWDDVALAAAEIAVAFGAVVLLTGSIWARASWGKWWTWEKRLTMSLLLWLVLVGYVMVRRFAGATAERLAAGLAVFGTVGVPFIYVMVDKGENHPLSGAGGVVATLPPEMSQVMWLSVLTFLMWFFALVWSRVASARAERQIRELREHALDAGLIQ